MTRHPSAIIKQFGTQQGIDVGDTVPAAYLHPFAVIDNDEPGSAVQIVMQGIPLTPMKAQNIGSIVGNGSGRVIEDGYTRLSIAQFTKTDGTRSCSDGHLVKNGTGHSQAKDFATGFNQSGLKQKNGR